MTRALPALTAICALAALSGAAPSHAQTTQPQHRAQAQRVAGSAAFKAAQASLARDYDRVVQDTITLTEIEAPPFKEDKRAAAYMEMLRQAGLADVQRDEIGNVFGYRRGTGGGPLIVVTAHLDTVFPEGTNVKVRREGDKLYAPGIGDDTVSLAVLLAYVRAMDAAKIRTKADIIFMGNVGEEGPGDLRGVRYLFGKGPLAGKINYFISFEPGQGRVTNGGVGSRRYETTFKGPGGHSYGAFGLVSPAYALGNAIAEFGKVQAPAQPKTTYNVGLISGGASVNSIPSEMSMTIDMRSEGAAELKSEEDQYLAIVAKAAAGENAARSTREGEITVENKLVGDRPVGLTDPAKTIVQIAAAAHEAAGVKPVFNASSTDSNLPMSLGIEAVTLGSGFATERAHAPDEALTLNRPEDLKYMGIGLAAVLALAGAETR